MSFNKRRAIIKRTREKFEQFDYRNMVDRFESIVNKYSNEKYSKQVPFIKKTNVINISTWIII